MNVAQLFVRCLAAEGVRYVFGVPGEENEDLLFALHESAAITFVPTRHEQGAAFIADVWGRLTGEAGVCLSTLGPGATNLVTGVADANLDKAPLVAITGQGSTTRLHHESHQYIDVMDMFRPITKWNASVSEPHIVTETVRKAFKIATAEKPGATHLELPEDIAGHEFDDVPVPLPVRAAHRSAPNVEALEATLELLASSQRPLIVAGNGVVRKGGTPELEALAVGHGLPVVSTFMGKGAVSDRLDISLYAVGLGFADYVMEAMDESDLVLAVGYDVAEYDPEAWNPDGSKRIVHLDFQPADVFAHYTPDVEVVCDVAAGLAQLHRRIDETGLTFDTEWYRPIRARIEEDIESYRLEEGDPFHVPGVLGIVREALPDHGLLISDVGSHKMWIARNFPTYCPGGCIISNGLASMGIALPGGIAAAMVDPDRPVVSAMGDGGFLMNVQELETATRLGVGFTCLVFVDNDYGLISWKQEQSRSTSVGTRLTNPDIPKLAESFGIDGYRPESVEELRAVLHRVIPSGVLSLVEVPIETAVNRELTDKLTAFWS